MLTLSAGAIRPHDPLLSDIRAVRTVLETLDAVARSVAFNMPRIWKQISCGRPSAISRGLTSCSAVSTSIEQSHGQKSMASTGAKARGGMICQGWAPRGEWKKKKRFASAGPDGPQTPLCRSRPPSAPGRTFVTLGTCRPHRRIYFYSAHADTKEDSIICFRGPHASIDFFQGDLKRILPTSPNAVSEI